MGIQFLLGLDHESRHDYLIQMIKNKRSKNQSILYIVPDNVKFEAEMMLLQALKGNKESTGMIDLQVYSFSRLAWLLNTGEVEAKTHLSSTGMSMLISKILHENEEQLTIFKKEIDNPGFIEQLVKLFSEFRGGQLSAEVLSNLVSQEKKHTFEFEQKIKELSLIYSKFELEIGEKFSLSEDLLIQLQEDIKRASLQDTIIIIDHYNYFTANELKVIEAFTKYTKQVWINLTMTNSPSSLTKEEKIFFNQEVETYLKIQAMAMNNSLIIHDDIICSNRNKNNSVIKGLNKWWYDANTQWNPLQPASEVKRKAKQAIKIYEYNDKKTEVFHTATKIKQLIATGNYRMKDFLILSRDLESYQLVIDQVFQEMELAYFINHPHSMVQHPLFEFVESLFKIIQFNFRHEDVLRFLKTELVVPDLKSEEFSYINHLDQSSGEASEENYQLWETNVNSWRKMIDVTENVALALGYDHDDWLSEDEWIYARFDLEDLTNQEEQEKVIQDQANLLKTKFQQIIIPFKSQLLQTKTYKELIQFLYEWILSVGVRDQLLFWRDQMIAEGRLEEALKHEQAWDALMEIFDEWVELLGEDEWSFDLFLSIVESGFNQKQYQSIPPKIDQILVDNYDHRSLTYRPIVFLLGMNNQTVPMYPSNHSLLTDEDREILKEELPGDTYIRNSSLDRSLDEPFNFLEAISQASDQLIFSYATTELDRNDLKLSSYVETIKTGFDIQVEKLSRFSKSEDSLNEQLNYISTEISAFEFYLFNKIHNKELKESSINQFWAALVNKLVKPSDNTLDHTRINILESEHYRNQVIDLPPSLAKQLYLPTDEFGDVRQSDLYLSVSQIESFFADPFGHFLRYGLKLQERPTLQLTPMERGNFFHDILDRFIKELINTGKMLSELSDDQLDGVVERIFSGMMQERTYRVLSKTPIMKFNSELLKRTIKNFVEVMRYQSEYSMLQPKYSEVLFGRIAKENGLPSLSLPLSHGGQIKVRGKIDRIDYYPNMDLQTGYFNVVDYKSSDQTLDFKKMLLGVQLQLLTYLNVVEKNADRLFNDGLNHQKLGMFYSHVHLPLIDLAALGNSTVDREIKRNLRLKGMNIEDIAIFKEIFKEELQNLNEVLNIRITGQNQFHGQDKKIKVLLNDKEFDPILRYSELLIQNAGNSILSGETRLEPLEGSGIHAPSLNEYQGISQFDPALPYNQSLKIDDLKFNKEIVLNEMIEQLQEGRIKDVKDYFNK